MEEENELKNSTKKKLAKKDEEIEKAKADCEHWKNEYYSCYADMANLRKEIERDRFSPYLQLYYSSLVEEIIVSTVFFK